MASQPPPLPSRTFRVPQLPASRGGPAPGSGTDADSRFAPGVTRRSGRDTLGDTALGTRMGGQVFGVPVAFSSTNLYIGQFDPEYDKQTSQPTGKGTITLEFVSGATYEYPSRSKGDWLDIIHSGSKGRKAYWDIRGPGPSRKGMGIWPFKQIKQAWRSKEQIAAIVGKRQPRGTKQKQRTFISRGKVVRLGPSIH